MRIEVIKVRKAAEMEAVGAMVWEFFDVLRHRYPDMLAEIDDYIAKQDVVGQLRNFAATFLPPDGECFLALGDGEPAGIVMLRRRSDSEGEMNRMYVREAARGQGLGRRLAEALVAEARVLGFETLWLGALFRHVEALPLYESIGFQRCHDPSAPGAADPRFIHMKLSLRG